MNFNHNNFVEKYLLYLIYLSKELIKKLFLKLNYKILNTTVYDQLINQNQKTKTLLFLNTFKNNKLKKIFFPFKI